jgi:Uma2 family endonuclease
MGAEFARQLPPGIIITECSILTRIGIRVPDVVWGSHTFMQDFGEITPYLQAPEICVEIVSPSNVEAEIHEKTAAYLAAGAREVWVVNEQGSIRIMGPQGEKPASDFPVRMTLPAAALKR